MVVVRFLYELIRNYQTERLAEKPLKLLQEYEFYTIKRLEKTRILVRVGPMLGLMGTLIPLSPALKALANNDTQKLADNLTIAFSVTVIGLLIGGLAFIISIVRDRIYSQDISDLEYLLELLEGNAPRLQAGIDTHKPAKRRRRRREDADEGDVAEGEAARGLRVARADGRGRADEGRDLGGDGGDRAAARPGHLAGAAARRAGRGGTRRRGGERRRRGEAVADEAAGAPAQPRRRRGGRRRRRGGRGAGADEEADAGCRRRRPGARRARRRGAMSPDIDPNTVKYPSSVLEEPGPNLRYMHRRRVNKTDRNGDPLDGVVNLFNVAIVLALGFLLATLTGLGLSGVLSKQGHDDRHRPRAARTCRCWSSTTTRCRS